MGYFYAPVAAIRAAASAGVVQVTEVPALFTRGKAKHCVPPAHWVMTNLPLTHWAKPPLTQAGCEPEQGEFGVRAAKEAFEALAFLPLSRVKGLAPEFGAATDTVEAVFVFAFEPTAAMATLGAVFTAAA